MRHCSLIITLLLSILIAQPVLAKQIKGIIFYANSNEIEILIPTGKTVTIGMPVEIFKSSDKDHKQSIGIWTITRTDINLSFAAPVKTQGQPKPGYIALIGRPELKPEQKSETITAKPVAIVQKKQDPSASQPVKQASPQPVKQKKKTTQPSVSVVKPHRQLPKTKIRPVKAPIKKIIVLSDSDQKLFNDLSSDNAALIRAAARKLSQKKYESHVVMDKAARILQLDYNKAKASSLHVDTMAWLCKALWASGEPKYIEILREVEKQARYPKLKKYAYKYRRGLEKIARRQIKRQNSRK